MFKHQHQQLTLLLIVLVSLAGNTQAAPSLEQEQQLLNRQQQQLIGLQSQQEKLQNRIEAANTALTPLLDNDSPEQLALSEAKQALATAQLNHDKKQSPESQSRLKNIEFKYVLAERKFKKANAERFQLQEDIADLSKKLQTINQEISLLSNTIGDQRLYVERARSSKAAVEQSRIVNEQRRKADEAAAEIARLKAQIAEQERQETLRIEQAMREAEEKLEQEELAKKAAAANQQAETAQSNQTDSSLAVEEKTADINDENSSIRFLATSELVMAEEKRVAELLARPEGKNTSRYNKILNVKQIANNGSSGRAVSNTLKALGHNIFRGKAKLNGGDNLFIIGFNRWQQSIYKDAQQTEFAFIYDGSDPKNPRLSYFPEALANSF